MAEVISVIWGGIQAIGAIASIIAAVWIARISLSRESDKDKMQVQALISALHSHAVAAVDDIDRAFTALSNAVVMHDVPQYLELMRVKATIPESIREKSWILPHRLNTLIAQYEAIRLQHERHISDLPFPLRSGLTDNESFQRMVERDIGALSSIAKDIVEDCSLPPTPGYRSRQ